MSGKKTLREMWDDHYLAVVQSDRASAKRPETLALAQRLADEYASGTGKSVTALAREMGQHSYDVEHLLMDHYARERNAPERGR